MTLPFTSDYSFRFCLCVAVLVLLSACKIELNTNLNEQEANEMMAKLISEGINVSKSSTKEGVTLMVDSAHFGDAVDVLAANGLPRRAFSTMGEIFANEGLVPSPLQEWARFNYAKAQELSQSISTIPGVVKADVHIAANRQQTPFDKVSPPSASVLIQMHEDRITSDLVPQIKQLVSFSIPDIKYERVSVIVSPLSTALKAQETVSIFGITMLSISAQRFKIVLGGLAGGAVLVAGLVGFAMFAFGRRRDKSGARDAKSIA
jgi:type III secretion protein J